MKKKDYKYIISVDSGSDSSGFTVLEIGQGANHKRWYIHEAIDDMKNSKLVEYINNNYSSKFRCLVLIEDVKAYSTQMGQTTIDTIKFIGELRYCMRAAGVDYLEIPRSTIKEWVYWQFAATVRPLLDKKVEYRAKMQDKAVLAGKKDKNTLVTKDGGLKSPTFVWIDDRMVSAAMRSRWAIVKPPVGKKAAYGLKNHSFQALALGSYFIDTY